MPAAECFAVIGFSKTSLNDVTICYIDVPHYSGTDPNLAMPRVSKPTFNINVNLLNTKVEGINWLGNLLARYSKYMVGNWVVGEAVKQAQEMY